MSLEEKGLLSAAIRSATGYLEFGSGGSTQLAHSLMQGPVYAVDSSREWLEKVSEAVAHDPRVGLLHVNIGPTREWGYPISKPGPDIARRYHALVWDEIGDTAKISHVFIDGRFRVACFAQAVLRTQPTTLIMLHDYRRRPIYHIVEEIAAPVAEIGDLTLFIAKAGAGPRAQEILSAREVDPR